MGHGWVYPNASGVRARCGGPEICYVCEDELNQKKAEVKAKEIEYVSVDLTDEILGCDLCGGRRWLAFHIPNPLNVKGGCCPACNKDGSALEDYSILLRTLKLTAVSFETR